MAQIYELNIGFQSTNILYICAKGINKCFLFCSAKVSSPIWSDLLSQRVFIGLRVLHKKYVWDTFSCKSMHARKVE